MRKYSFVRSSIVIGAVEDDSTQVFALLTVASETLIENMSNDWTMVTSTLCDPIDFCIRLRIMVNDVVVRESAVYQ